MTRLFAGTPFDIPPECEDCGKLEAECVCTAEQKRDAEAQRQREADRIAPGKQTARIELQKRKGGRRATVVLGLTAKANDLAAVLQQLQAACGAGGTVKAKQDMIELQGEHSDAVRTKLRELGYRVK